MSRQPGVLDGWIDFNRNGDFNDPGEQISTSTSVQLGTNSFLISVPTNALAGPVFARFRLSTAGGLSPLGAAADGEVEDYRINLEAPPLNFEVQPLLSGHGLTLVTTPGFAYTLQYVTNTTAKFWGWSDVTNFVDIPGTGAFQTFTDTNALEIGIYRLKRVQLP